MNAALLFHEKRIVTKLNVNEIAIAEIKIWEVPRSDHYPEGIKFSLFLVSEGRILVGLDNHRPKGPHQHTQSGEVPYHYVDEKQLLEDFWSWVKKKGFKP